MSKKLYYLSCEIYKNGTMKYVNSEYFTSEREAREVLKVIKKNDCVKFYYLESIYKSEYEKYSYTHIHGRMYKQIELIAEINKIIKFMFGSSHKLPEPNKKSLQWLNNELIYLQNLQK